MHSLDMVNENIKKIGNLFPECVTETVDENGNVKAAIDFEKLQENLSHATIGEGEERYQFTWPGKREAIHNANAPTNMTLRPCKEESVNFDNTENLYIEGDNLEVLKLLQENYLGKVKMIYIDPPYNTGNDFVYNDDFKEDTESFQSKSGMYDEDGNMLLQNFEKNTESNGRFHTDWLNMMYPRLKIARNLLSDDGVMFISIDDNEQGNLKKICDEVFGEGNLVGIFCWTKKKKGSHLSKTFRSMTEYVMCYSRRISGLELYGEEAYSDKWQPIVKKTNAVKILSVPTNLVSTNLANGVYPAGLYAQDTTPIRFLNDLRIENGVIVSSFQVEGPFVWTQQKLEEEIRLGTKFSLSNKFGFNVFRADQLDKVKRPSSIIDSKVNVGTNEDASIEIEQLFGRERIMDYPKPSSLIKYLVRTLGYYDKNLLVLDFFSGSATTAHAVMQLNAEDGGKRKYICVQLPEATAEDSEAYKAGYKNICEIGKERIRRAGKKIMEGLGSSTSLNGSAQNDNTSKTLDIGFRVLKLADSNMKDVYYSPAETDSADIFDVNNVKEDRTPLDLLFQVMPECNLPLSSKIEERTIEGRTVYFVNGNYLVACFDEGITEKLIKSVIDVPDSDKPYYFYMRNLGLESDKVLDNFEQLFVHYSPSTKRKVI